jgi:hypothetical protein
MRSWPDPALDQQIKVMGFSGYLAWTGKLITITIRNDINKPVVFPRIFILLTSFLTATLNS